MSRPPADVSRLLQVGVGDVAASAARGDVLATYALGSCVAVVAHDATAGAGALAHVQLPRSTSASSAYGPWAAADQAVPELLRRLEALGARRARLRVILAGGATILDPTHYFQIGKKNGTAVRLALWKEGVLIAAERLGGEEWRTVHLEIATGRVTLRTARGMEGV